MQVTPHPPYGHPLPYLFSVAQIVNLPYRRLQIGRALAVFRRPDQGAVLQDGILRYSRLAVCATNTSEALVCCSQIGWAFVAPHLAFGAARRGSISAAICDRGATKPKAKCGATLRSACLFGPGFVVRSLQTAEGSARRSRL